MATYRYRVVNLARSRERRETMEARLRAAGLADRSDFFAAVDGESLRGDAAVLRRLRRARYVHRRSLSYGEVGCMESHRGVWRELLGSSDDFYVVLEDDVELLDGLDDVVAALTGGDFGVAPDFVRLQATQYVETRCVSVCDLPAGRRLTLDYGPSPDGGVFGVGLLNTTRVLKDWLLGVAGYLVSRAGAERLLEHTADYLRPPDVEVMRFWEHGLPPLVVYPAVVETRNEVPSVLGRLRSENYGVPPFRWWDVRYQLFRAPRMVSRRYDVFCYCRFVGGLRERYGEADHVHPATFRYGGDGLSYFIPRD
ncbi:MAG: glycosyltransferase family 25 protein [Alphaproteobacteria bacterium]|nr:glycosyltransferase family 25 protein [Alphaproteobacteria bacterium]MDA8004370.1 glycosyltransferase family 25 protein [Alphaproteobacteria bacterium]MDA8005941.1 glycosyltransferase family 25 protein [Alphaproteobacteria bacterium]MDA8012780.1 glycosyltransferase family 25 protein [Alphaproteobacteria bacterium]